MACGKCGSRNIRIETVAIDLRREHCNACGHVLTIRVNPTLQSTDPPKVPSRKPGFNGHVIRGGENHTG